MTRVKKLLLGAVALTTLTAGGIAASAHRGGWGGRGHGEMGMGGPMGGMIGRVCAGDASEMADLMLVRLEYQIKPTDAQRAAFDDLKTATKAAAVKVKAGCPAVPARAADGTPPPRKSPTERLALLETGLAAQLDAVRTVRPAADKLYATLTDAQKAAFPIMGGGKAGWRHGGYGDERDMRGRDDRESRRGDRRPAAAPDSAPTSTAPTK